jgi:signal peptidase II
LRIKAAGRVFAIFLLLTTIGCDRVTKHVATTRLAGKPGVSYLANTFRLEYAENPGAFMSLGSGLPDWARTGLLTFGAGVGLVAVAAAASRLRWIGLPLIGGILFIAGGTSNLVDRITRGSVVDFMNVGIGSLRTGIFNVADVALVVGVVLIVFGFHDKRCDRPRVPSVGH